MKSSIHFLLPFLTPSMAVLASLSMLSYWLFISHQYGFLSYKTKNKQDLHKACHPICKTLNLSTWPLTLRGSLFSKTKYLWYVQSFVKIHWRMLILGCLQWFYRMTDRRTDDGMDSVVTSPNKVSMVIMNLSAFIINFPK